MDFQSNLNEVLKKLSDSKKQTLQEVGTFLTAEAQTRATVKTGNMRRSTTFEIVGENEVDVGVTPEADYAIYIEKGTLKQPAQPFIEPAVMDNVSEIEEITKNSFSVNMGGD